MAGFELVSEVTTRETDFDGTRHMEWSGWDSNTAPADHVIKQNEIRFCKRFRELSRGQMGRF